MSTKVILHVGQQKSGTTHLQNVLGRCGEGLAEHGVLFPPSMRERLPGSIENHERATYGLLGTEFGWVSRARAEQERPHWERLLRHVHEWSGTSLLSAEALSVVRTPAVREIVGELACDGTPPEIVVTTRPLGRTLPSLWQQHVRNGRSVGLDAFFDLLTRQRDRADTLEDDPDLHLWRSFRLGRLVRRWAAEVGPERVTVVINPGMPRDALWRRFTEAIGAPGLAAPDVAGDRTHTGLTLPQAELLLRLNSALEDGGWPTLEARAMRAEIITRSRSVGRAPGVPAAAADLVRRWTEEDLAELDGMAGDGVRVVGDTGELRFDPDRHVGAPATAEELAEAGAAALLAVTEPSRYLPAEAAATPAPRRPRRWVRR